MTPVGLYGLEIPPGNVLIPAMQEDSYPDACVSCSSPRMYSVAPARVRVCATSRLHMAAPLALAWQHRDSYPPGALDHWLTQLQYRITMAALDPTEAPEADEEGNIPAVPRSTLKLIRQRTSGPSGDDELSDEYLEALMGGGSDDDDEDDEDDEAGPSDPSKSKKAQAEAAIKKLIAAAQEEEDSDEEMGDAKPNSKAGKKAKKGKEPATSSDDDDESDEDEEDDLDMESFVVCTLDTERVSPQSRATTPPPD